MPSGYTEPIYAGKEITFAQFASSCARAFGALVTLRDEPITDELPEKLEPAAFYCENVKEQETELARLKSLTPEQCEEEAAKEYKERRASASENIQKAKAMRQRYEAMLREAQAWEPPTADHTGLKEYMVNQLTESMRFDCNTSYWEEILETPRRSGHQWHSEKIASAEKRLARARESYAEEIERTAQRNLWIQQLRDSLA